MLQPIIFTGAAIHREAIMKGPAILVKPSSRQLDVGPTLVADVGCWCRPLVNEPYHADVGFQLPRHLLTSPRADVTQTYICYQGLRSYTDKKFIYGWKIHKWIQKFIYGFYICNIYVTYMLHICYIYKIHICLPKYHIWITIYETYMFLFSWEGIFHYMRTRALLILNPIGQSV